MTWNDLEEGVPTMSGFPRYAASAAGPGTGFGRPWAMGCAAQPRSAPLARIPGAVVCPQTSDRHEGSGAKTRAPAP